MGHRAGLDGRKISSPPGFDPRTAQPTPIRSAIKYQVASGRFFDSSVITMMHGPINIRFHGLYLPDVRDINPCRLENIY